MALKANQNFQSHSLKEPPNIFKSTSKGTSLIPKKCKYFVKFNTEIKHVWMHRLPTNMPSTRELSKIGIYKENPMCEPNYYILKQSVAFCSIYWLTLEWPWRKKVWRLLVEMISLTLYCGIYGAEQSKIRRNAFRNVGL